MNSTFRALMKHQLSDLLGSLQGPFVHYCKGVEPSSVLKAVGKTQQNAKMVEIDGSHIPNLKSLIAELNEKLGFTISYDDTNSDELLWMRLEDIASTDIDFAKSDGCILVIGNAEQILKSTKYGLIKFAQTMQVAGDERANPMRHIHGVKPEFALEPKFVHTVFCYNRIPQNAPIANKIKAQYF